MEDALAQMFVGIVPIFLHAFCTKERSSDFLVGLAGEPAVERPGHELQPWRLPGRSNNAETKTD
jgi:hypothetical protein